MNTKLTKYERETVISFNEKEDVATVYTCSTQVKNRLKELSLKNSDIYREKEDEYSQTYIIPKKIIRFTLPRELSVEEKQKRAIRLQQNVEMHNAQGTDGKEVI